MRWRQSFSTILVGKSILLREGLAGMLHSADFRILASVSCADDLPASNLQQQQQLFIVVHTGDDFAAAIEQIELFREQHPGGRIAVVADHYRLDELVSAFRAGANGYFVDVMTCDAFIKSMELLMMGETIFPPASVIRSRFQRRRPRQGSRPPRRGGTGRRKRPGGPRHNRRRVRAAAFSAGEINSALPDRGRLQQRYRAKGRYRRSHREGPRQGDPSQDPGP